MGVVPVRPQARDAMAEAIEDLLVQLGVENPREGSPYDEEGHLLSSTPDSPAEIVSAAAVQAFLAAEEIGTETQTYYATHDVPPKVNRRLCGPWRRVDG